MPLDVITSEPEPSPHFSTRIAELEKEMVSYKKVAGDIIEQKDRRIAEPERQIDDKNIEAASGPHQPVAIYAAKDEPSTATPSRKRFLPKKNSPVKRKNTRQLGCRIK